ncbi:MAG TPA: metallophosphoesterase [bacterium]|nr:metallophosphoesterase [bacterium]
MLIRLPHRSRLISAPGPERSEAARCRAGFRRTVVLSLLVAVVVAAGLGLSIASAARGDCPLRIAVIGDRTGAHEPGKYEEIVAEVARLKPDLVMTVGDMIEGYESDSTVIKAEWKEYKNIIKPLTVPIHFTSGNHDIWDARSRSLYKRYADEPYYSFDVGTAHFVVLENGRYATIDAFPREQMDWLKEDLRSHRDAAYTLVFMHIPYWTQTLAEGKPDALHNLFVEYGVDAVFSGHDHTYFSGEYGGIKYTGVGSSGAYCGPGITGLAHHFVWVNIDGKGMAITPIRIGSVLPWDEVPIKDYKLVGKIDEDAVQLSRVRVGTALTVSEAPVSVTVKNLNQDITIKSPLKWDAPTGWTVTPREQALEIAPLDKRSVDFTLGTDTSIYPAPVVEIQYPYGEGKTRDLRKPVPIQRTAYAYRVARPPDIDGKLTDKAWKEPVTAFFAPDGTAMTAEPTSFYFAYDADNLYIAVRCTESEMKSLAAAFKERDDPVHGEDCVGFFFEPKTGDGPVYQIYFNPLGTVFDQKITVSNGVATKADPKWDGKYTVKTRRGKDYWSIEAKIQLAALGTSGKPGKAWAVNFRRKQKRLDTAADWQVPTGYDPRDYGELVFK